MKQEPTFSPEMAREKIRQAKFEINLADYAQQYGYEMNPSKSTRTDTILQKKVDGNVQDTIGIRYYEQTGYKYWTAMDSSDKGSILDFECRKNNLDFSTVEGKKQFYQKVDEFLGQPHHSRILPAQKASEETAIKRLTDRELHLLPLTDTRYLEGRGITETTYRSPEFTGQVYNEHVEFNGRTFTNTAFPLRNEEVVLAKIRRNDELLGYGGGQFNKIQEKRENGVHTSNFPSGRLDTLYLSESPIDAMSYFELHQATLRSEKQQVAFISTGGNPSLSAYHTIQKYINEAQPSQLVSLMDNDRAGKVFTINLLGKLAKPDVEQSTLVKAEINVSQRTESTLGIHFAFKDEAQRIQLAKQLKEHLIEPLKKAIPEGSEAEIKTITLEKSAHNAHVQLKFPYQKEYLSIVEKGLIAVKGLEKGFSVEHASQKDWNDELKRTKPFVTTLERNGVDLPEKRFARGVEAYLYAQEREQTTHQKTNVVFEHYNKSHEVDKPKQMVTFHEGKVVNLSPILEKEVELHYDKIVLARRLEQEKLLVISLSKQLFPENECVLTKCTFDPTTKQHAIELQAVNKKPLEAGNDLPRTFAQNTTNAQTNTAVLIFQPDKETPFLSIPALKESTPLEKELTERHTTLVKETSEREKGELLKKSLENHVGELTLSDRAGDIIATSDYQIKLENGKPVVRTIDNFDYDKINREGLKIGVIKNALDEASQTQQQHKVPDEKIDVKKDMYKKKDNGLDL